MTSRTRFIFAAILAIGGHLFLLFGNIEVFQDTFRAPNESDRVTMTLFQKKQTTKTSDTADSKIIKKKEPAEEVKTEITQPPTPEPKMEKIPPRPVAKPNVKTSPANPPKKSFHKKKSAPRKAPTQQKVAADEPSQPVEKKAVSPNRDGNIEVLQSAVGSVPAAPIPSAVTQAVPLYRFNPPPIYPRRARKRGYQGKVLLEVLVKKDGRVADLRIHTSSGHAILDNAALKSVRTWRFEPGKRDNGAIEMWVRVPVKFLIQ